MRLIILITVLMYGAVTCASELDIPLPPPTAQSLMYGFHAASELIRLINN